MTDVRALDHRSFGQRHPLLAALWRVRQGLHVLHNRADPAVDAELRRLVGSEALWGLLVRLTPFDRAHHLRVYQLLREDGCDDPEVLLAGLLHDVGKADGHARAHVGHRTLKVLLQRCAPRLLERVSLRPHHWVLHGLYLSVHHARLGAELAAAAGVSARCRELIARHEARPPFDDPGLAALVAADEGAIR